jgi:hypothetical protein
VRENTEQIRPPRALWVPFPLGRPFGAPHDAAFQRDVVKCALALLERQDGPVILEDFPRDAPGQDGEADMEGMICPVRLPRPGPLEQSTAVTEIKREMVQLAPWRERFLAASGRTIVGISGMAIEEAVAFLGTVLETGRSDSVDDGDLGMAVRNTTEDLRNWYVEAASARPGGAASGERLADWFWGETAAGALILALHPVALASENPGFRHVGERALVPRVQQHRLAD